ncbi:adenine phosphoribosyltransferase [Stackebrandtia albiflava]|uniref:adenine phosphoribosyltransferase n=1 Tax=Stackebrandtia albiflava TaxID=406432 RepID=UPI0011BDC2EA|nr:adenine phosphoribosyltransferase [Stackebrandtia albiflava]
MTADSAVEVLAAATRWDGDRLATLAWWTDARLLSRLGAALADLHRGEPPTLVAGVQSSGYLLAPLVANVFGVGMLGVQKLPQPDGRIMLATVAGRPDASDRVLLVDDVVETGAQAAAVKDLVEATGARWSGVAAMVSYGDFPELGVWSLADVDSLRPAG